MPIKEKRIVSLRYLWRLFTYALDGCLMILCMSIGRCMLMLQENNRLQDLVDAQKKTHIFLNEDLFDIILMVLTALCGLAFLGILAALCRFISYDLEQRREVRGLMHALGYQRTDILLYEEAYVLFDLICAYVLSVLMAWLLWLIIKGNEFVSTLCGILGTSLFVDWVSVVCPAVFVIVTVFLLTVRKTAV